MFSPKLYGFTCQIHTDHPPEIGGCGVGRGQPQAFKPGCLNVPTPFMGKAIAHLLCRATCVLNPVATNACPHLMVELHVPSPCSPRRSWPCFPSSSRFHMYMRIWVSDSTFTPWWGSGRDRTESLGQPQTRGEPSGP